MPNPFPRSRKIAAFLIILPLLLVSGVAFPNLVVLENPSVNPRVSGGGLAFFTGEASAIRVAARSQDSYRVKQAKELMGLRYDESPVKVGELVPDVQQFVRRCTYRGLRGHWKRRASGISMAILRESQRNEFDPVFVMSVIQTESKWRPHARGTHGEIGLMQIKPSTARWVAGMYGIPFKGRRTLRDPLQNIRIGSAYLAFLRGQFDSRGILYVSAYNAGVGTVRRALRRSGVPPQAYVAQILEFYTQYYATLRAEQLDQIRAREV